MPLSIIRDDITRIKCDAIVNPTNEKFIPGGGVDKHVHRAAGNELYEMCTKLGGLEVGQAKITPAYNLPCKFVIHTVGPCWDGGDNNEEFYLRSCYEQSLKIARATKCESIAFPLISSGTYGYPKDQVLAIALDILKNFLKDYEMMIYLVVFDKTSYILSQSLQDGISSFIDEHYVGEKQDCFEKEEPTCYEQLKSPRCKKVELSICSTITNSKKSITPDKCIDNDAIAFKQSMPAFGTVGSIHKHLRPSFREMLFDFIAQKGANEVDCYKNANVSRQTWSKIVNDKYYIPKKTTIIALSISLKLNLNETQELLSTMGYILSKAILFDTIIMYCITKGIYDVFEIDSILFQYDQKTLFSIE